MVQSISTYTCALEKEFYFTDLQRDNADDLQESHINDWV